MKLLIGIPAYNEALVLKKTIKSLPQRIKGVKKIDILVVNDGSRDATEEVARNTGAIVLSHLINRGLGGVLKTIFGYAKLMAYDILVTFDADGQHNSGDIERLIKPILQGKRDVVIGTRWKKMLDAPFSRLIVNQLANIITYLLFGIWTSDSQSGFRAFSRKAIQAISLQTDGMEVSSEIFREIYRNKLSYSEIPIHPIYTSYSKSKGQRLDNAPNVFFQLIFRLLR